MDIREEKLFKEIAKAALKKIVEFNSQNLANTVWAFATDGIEAQNLFVTNDK